MGEKKYPVFLSEKKLKEEFGLDWSRDTLKRRIESGFPAIKDDGGGYLFETKKVLEWIKRREVN